MARYQILKMGGVVHQGRGFSVGTIYHAVNTMASSGSGRRAALCTAKPMAGSIGWDKEQGSAVTCAKCLKALLERGFDEATPNEPDWLHRLRRKVAMLDTSQGDAITLLAVVSKYRTALLNVAEQSNDETSIDYARRALNYRPD